MLYKIEEVLLSWRKLRIVFFKQKKFFFWRRQKWVLSQGAWTDLPLPMTMGVLCLSIVLHTWMGTCSSIWAGRLIFTGCGSIYGYILIFTTYIKTHLSADQLGYIWIYVDPYISKLTSVQTSLGTSSHCSVSTRKGVSCSSSMHSSTGTLLNSSNLVRFR